MHGSWELAARVMRRPSLVPVETWRAWRRPPLIKVDQPRCRWRGHGSNPKQRPASQRAQLHLRTVNSRHLHRARTSFPNLLGPLFFPSTRLNWTELAPAVSSGVCVRASFSTGSLTITRVLVLSLFHHHLPPPLPALPISWSLAVLLMTRHQLRLRLPLIRTFPPANLSTVPAKF